jgi:hypothetical protein
MRFAKFLSIVSLCAHLQSQPRQENKPSNQQQVKSDDEQTHSSVTVIHQLYTQAEDGDKAKGKNYEDRIAFLEAVGTFLLFVATAALCYVALLQRRTMEAHKQSLEAMAGHMQGGLTETRKAANAAKDSADAARKSFIAAHRPRLTIRFVTTVSEIGEAGQGVSGDFLVYNTGGTAAILERCYSEVIVGDSLPTRSNRYTEEAGEALGAILLLPGQSTIVRFPTGGPKRLDPDEHIAIRKRQESVSTNPMSGNNWSWSNLFLIGWIGYIDESRKARRAGFCRRYDFAEKRFVVNEDHDYQYED